MRVNIIAAVAANGVIGYQGRLPWQSKEDLRHFAQTTRDSTLIMGRKTFESIGKPLAGRTTIVVSRNTRLQLPGCEIRASLPEALSAAKELGKQDVYIAGGGEIYRLALNHTHRMILSKFIELSPKGDTYFPWINPAEWQLSKVQQSRSEPAFVIEYLERITPKLDATD